MSTTGRILAGIVVAILVLGFAALELVSERVPAPPAFPQPAPAYLADGAGEQGQAPGAVQRIVVRQDGQPGDGGLEP